MRHQWTVSERRFVVESWGDLSLDEIAQHLGIPWRSVRECARRMGLKAYEGHRHERWTREEDARLRLLSGAGVPMQAISRVMGRSAEACRKRSYVVREEVQ